ncbi:TrkH family potassium uptake protein [Rothia mucilaginosa]|uniref:TrkH family potassium uptake protein n=1 Tax=Rothia mucilaginosa TaxID=43675 RepID=UPI003C7E6EEF
MGRIIRRTRRRHHHPHGQLNRRWDSLSGITSTPDKQAHRTRHDRLEAENLSILTSVPGIKLDRIPALRDHAPESPEAAHKRAPLAFNVQTLERFRDFIDVTVLASPSRTAITAFFLVIIFFTLTLLLPISSNNGQPAPFHHAFFTATSAVTVTGLTTVSTADQWSTFGQAMILVACQVGGLGTLTITSLLALAIGRKMGLRTKLIAQEDLNISRLGEVGGIVKSVSYASFSIEAIIAIVLIPRFLTLGEDPFQAIWHSIFYAISAFNNAGFTPHSDGIVPYGHDLFILGPICAAVFLGSLGFPVFIAIQRNPFHPSRWRLTAKLTMVTTLFFFLFGTVFWALFEWNNPATIGNYSSGDKILNAVFASIMMRSGGFNLVDMNSITPVSTLLTDMLMFIGGGSGSTAGGVKVTTIAVIALSILAEARGDQKVVAFNRTIPESSLRIAISVLVMSATMVCIGAATLVMISGADLKEVMFEVISAFGTCGLSSGLSSSLPPAGVYVLSALMLIGRIGTTTAATGLAMRSRRRLYKFPEERPTIG